MCWVPRQRDRHRAAWCPAWQGAAPPHTPHSQPCHPQIASQLCRLQTTVSLMRKTCAGSPGSKPAICADASQKQGSALTLPEANGVHGAGLMCRSSWNPPDLRAACSPSLSGYRWENWRPGNGKRV